MRNKENIPVVVAEIRHELKKLRRLVQRLSKVRGSGKNEMREKSSALRIRDAKTIAPFRKTILQATRMIKIYKNTGSHELSREVA